MLKVSKKILDLKANTAIATFILRHDMKSLPDFVQYLNSTIYSSDILDIHFIWEAWGNEFLNENEM